MVELQSNLVKGKSTRIRPHTLHPHVLPVNATRLRVATYNIHKCRGLDGRTRPERIVRVIRELDADIIALQEVLSIPGSKQARDHAKFIAEEAGFYSHFGENRKLYGRGYGNLLLTRFPLRAAYNYDISIPARERRGCLRVDIEWGEAILLHIFNVHLGTSFFERRQQALHLIGTKILNNRGLRGHRIVLGDFNDWTRGLASRSLASLLQSADIRKHLRRSRTYPGFLPFLHLDHIYHDAALKIEALSLHRSRTALVASDHVPLIADFRLHTARAFEKLAPQSFELAGVPYSVATT